MVLVQSPALDVMGVGLESGRIVLHNIATDQTIMSFRQDWGPVLSLAFRTGMSPITPLTSCTVPSSDGVSTMASGSSIGHVAVWDLAEKRLSSILHDAHKAAVTGLQFFPEQPLMVTSSSDNSLKVTINHKLIIQYPFSLRLGYLTNQMVVQDYYDKGKVTVPHPQEFVSTLEGVLE